MNGRAGVVGAIAVAVALGFWTGAAAAADPARPNVVLIVADDLGYADVGFHGGREIPTPNLDALAKSGVRCTSGYVSGPYCSPTRAGLLTGRYQQRFGHEFNPAGARNPNFGLPVEQTTLADRFKGAGYATGLVGKWHLGDAPRFHPQKRGFDEFFGFLAGAHTYFAAKSKDILRGTEPVEEPAYLTDALAREAVAFVDRHKARPFFLELAFNAVHTPMNATDERLARFSKIQNRTRRTYAAMLSALDEAVGRLVEKIRAEGLEENTLIVFISDNGGPTMEGTSVNGSRNEPLRGSKRTTLEGGIRVPFLLSWKGKLPAGSTYDPPVIQLDILPTALAAAGVVAKPEWNLDGVNLLPFLTGKETRAPHDALFWRLGSQWAVRKGDWKLVAYDPAMDVAGGRSGGDAGKASPPRLYHLGHDIGESRDLAAEEPAKVKELQAAWDAWNRGNIRPLWGGNARREGP